jgi:hypothetical protein
LHWEVVSKIHELNGAVPVVTKKLIGHVDNSFYPAIKVDIQLTLTTPAKATGPGPVMMEFGLSAASVFVLLALEILGKPSRRGWQRH